jgi:hypothetical protein
MTASVLIIIMHKISKHDSSKEGEKKKSIL